MCVYVQLLLMFQGCPSHLYRGTYDKEHSEYNNSLQRTHFAQTFTFLLFNLQRKDNLSIRDKMPGTNVSIFLCMLQGQVSLTDLKLI